MISPRDLEGARPDFSVRRLRFSRTRRLIARALYLAFLTLLLAGICYVNSYAFQSQILSRTSPASKSRPGPPLPRHPNYIIFEPPPPPSTPIPDRPLRQVARMPESCLDSHFALGYPCSNNKSTTFDVVWTWVNGSDHHLQQAMREAALSLDDKTRSRVASPNSKLYRDHDELRHSFRSVLQHFRPYIKNFHLFTSDFPLSPDEVAKLDPPEGSQNLTEASPLELGNRTLRMGQLPTWLRTEDQGYWHDQQVNVTVAYQAQVFRNYTGPSFNSYSIESQLPNLPDIEQNLIYMNDDFFFTGDLQPSDFATSAFGTVLRLDPKLLVSPAAADSRVNPNGEWGPLGYSSWLLSERFGARSRPYQIHAPKALAMPLLDEVARVWPAEFAATAAHAFRGASPDAYLPFLTAHFVVERWREALLWAWVVGRVGGAADEWGEPEQREAWRALGGGGEARTLPVHVTRRKTLDDARVAAALHAAGERAAGRTAYTFSSADGYPYVDGARAWPRFDSAPIGKVACTISFDECIAAASSASAAFTTVAFHRPQCGDCIVHALRATSGVLGLSAFLPPRGRTFDAPRRWDAAGARVPHLPLVTNWAAGNFTLQGVLAPYGGVNVRAWTLRLLERYRFVLGDTGIAFLIVTGPKSAQEGLRSVTKDVALLCLNDDVRQHHQMTDWMLREWQARRWRRPAEWER